MELLEIKSSLQKILEQNSIDWLSEDQENMIVLEAEEAGINNSEDLAGHLFFSSSEFKNSLS